MVEVGVVGGWGGVVDVELTMAVLRCVLWCFVLPCFSLSLGVTVRPLCPSGGPPG